MKSKTFYVWLADNEKPNGRRVQVSARDPEHAKKRVRDYHRKMCGISLNAKAFLRIEAKS